MPTCIFFDSKVEKSQQYKRQVPGYPRYSVTESGEVYNKEGKRIKPRLWGKYWAVSLWDGKKIHQFYVHRIVAITYINNPRNCREVNHKDGNKDNNHVSNLEWVTRSENMAHAYDSGLRQTTPVIMLTLDGIPLREFRSVNEAAKFCGVKYNAGISRCLAGIVETAHGYKWKKTQ